MAMSHDNESGVAPVEGQEEPVEAYERPEIIDYGTLSELTMSGLSPQTDCLGTRNSDASLGVDACSCGRAVLRVLAGLAAPGPPSKRSGRADLVAPSHQDANHTAFVLLLGGLYLEVRRRGFRVACGMMSAPVRAMCRQLGFRLELLGPDRRYWHEVRAPVRFEVGRDAAGLVERWRDDGEVSSR